MIRSARLVFPLIIALATIAAPISDAFPQRTPAIEATQQAPEGQIELHVGYMKRLQPGGWGVEPVPYVDVRLFHAGDPSATLGEGTSDAEGRVVLSVPLAQLALDDKGRTQVLCEPIHTGFIRKPRTIHSPSPGQYRANVYLEQGRTQEVHVRMEDEDCAVGLEACQWLAADGVAAPSDFTGPRFLRKTRASSVQKVGERHFYLHLKGEARADLVHVRAKDYGTAVALLPLDPGGGVESNHGPLEVHLRRAASMSGVVTGDDGAPTPRLQLLCYSTQLAQAPGYSSEDPMVSKLLAEGRGEVSSTAVTAMDGTFRFAGLRPGRYHITAPAPTGATKAKGPRILGTRILGTGEAG